MANVMWQLKYTLLGKTPNSQRTIALTALKTTQCRAQNILYANTCKLILKHVRLQFITRHWGRCCHFPNRFSLHGGAATQHVESSMGWCMRFVLASSMFLAKDGHLLANNKLNKTLCSRSTSLGFNLATPIQCSQKTWMFLTDQVSQPF